MISKNEQDDDYNSRGQFLKEGGKFKDDLKGKKVFSKRILSKEAKGLKN